MIDTQTRRIVIEVPLPPQGVQQNNRRHWRVTAKAVKGYRQSAKLCASIHSVEPLQGLVRVSADFYMAKTSMEIAAQKPIYYRPLDMGNAIASLKAAIDGIVDSGLLKGDSHKHLEWGRIRLYRTAKDHQGRSCVVLTFEEVD